MTAAQLAAALENGANADRVAAAQTLAASDPDSIRSAAAALVRGTADELVAEWCIAALEEMGPPPADQVPVLADLLDAPADAGYWAATLLGRLGDAAASAAPALIHTAQHGTVLAARERAVWALGKIGPAAADSVAALRSLTDSEHARLARLANQALEAIEG